MNVSYSDQAVWQAELDVALFVRPATVSNV